MFCKNSLVSQDANEPLFKPKRTKKICIILFLCTKSQKTSQLTETDGYHATIVKNLDLVVHQSVKLDLVIDSRAKIADFVNNN